MKRDKIEMTFCKTVITSSAELANLAVETLRDEPTKSLGEEAKVGCGSERRRRKKKMNVVIESVVVDGCFEEHSSILEL